MGTFYVKIEVGDVTGERFEQIDALAGSGAMTTVIPASVLHRLRIAPAKRRTFEYADGKQVELDMAETTIRVNGKATASWVVFGEDADGATLGAHTLAGVFLGVDPHVQRLIPVRPPVHDHPIRLAVDA